jgi:hypothetical protein
MRPRTPALAAIVAAVLLPASPALGDSETFKDGKTTEGAMDIHRVSVVNEKRLQVRIKVEDLQKKSGPSAGVWLDTDPEHKGPDFFIGSGLYQSEWQISRADGWKVTGDPLSCPVDQRLRYDDDVISWTTGPKCLGDYEEVRVSAEAHAEETHDYSPARHEWHSWIDRY